MPKTLWGTLSRPWPKWAIASSMSPTSTAAPSTGVLWLCEVRLSEESSQHPGCGSIHMSSDFRRRHRASSAERLTYDPLPLRACLQEAFDLGSGTVCLCSWRGPSLSAWPTWRDAKVALCDCRGRVAWLHGPVRALSRGNPFSLDPSSLVKRLSIPRSSQLFTNRFNLARDSHDGDHALGGLVGVLSPVLAVSSMRSRTPRSRSKAMPRCALHLASKTTYVLNDDCAEHVVSIRSSRAAKPGRSSIASAPLTAEVVEIAEDLIALPSSEGLELPVDASGCPCPLPHSTRSTCGNSDRRAPFLGCLRVGLVPRPRLFVALSTKLARQSFRSACRLNR